MCEYRISLAVVLIECAAAGLALVDAGLVFRLLAREGPVEHLSHAVLVLGIGVCWLASRRGGPNRAVPLLAAAYLALLPGEELDWGGRSGPDRA